MIPYTVSRSSTVVQLPADEYPPALKDGCFSPVKQQSFLADKNWTLCVHPQGWVYFYNPSLKVVTDQDIRQPEILAIIEASYAGYPLSDLSAAMEVHLHVQSLKDLQKPQESRDKYSMQTYNLTINHKYCIASSEPLEVTDASALLLGPHRLNRCRRLYWNFLWNHPAHVETPPRAIDDATDALTWFYTDNLISGAKSTVPFSKIECEELSRVIRGLTATSNERSIARTVFLAWLLREVCSYRDAENWGQLTQRESQAARKQKSTPAYTSTQPLSPVAMVVINFIINVLFFGIPHTYRAHVKITSEYRGRLSNVQKTWENYVDRLVREYSHFLLISTVLLSATVGFLAVPDIPEAAQVSATISTFASLGSIIVGVFSIWRHQANTTTADSFTYMHNVQHGPLGLYGHSILLSLPPTLLVWAILTFTLSVVIFVLHGLAETGTWEAASIWAVVGIFIVLLLAVVLALYTFSIIWKFQRRTASMWYRFTSFWTFNTKTKPLIPGSDKV